MVEVFLNRGYKVVSGGIENHLFLLDLVDKNLTGKEADAALGRANITRQQNSVPNDPKSPFVTSGIRIGSPAVTRRGFKKREVKELAGWMCDVLDNINDDAVIERVKGKSAGYLRPLPGICVSVSVDIKRPRMRPFASGD